MLYSDRSRKALPRNRVRALWPQVFELPERPRMVRRWKPAIGVFFPELTAVLARPAHRAHVLALRRDRVASLEALADADSATGLAARRDLGGVPGSGLASRSRRDRALLMRSRLYAPSLGGVRNGS